MQIYLLRFNIFDLIVGSSLVFTAGRSALARHLLWRRVCVSVCVYVTLMYCAQTTESISMRPLPDDNDLNYQLVAQPFEFFTCQI